MRYCFVMVDVELAQALGRDPAALCNAWVAALRLDPACGPPDALEGLTDLGPSLVEGLVQACGDGELDLASDHFRAVVRAFSLAGGQLASAGASPTLMAKLMPSLTSALAQSLAQEPTGALTGAPVLASAEALAAAPAMPPRHTPAPAGSPLLDRWRTLEVGLGAILLETYCLGILARERARLDEVLEKHTPVIRLPGDVPALLVVGRPSRQILSMLLGRVLLEVARMGADRLLVDFTHAQPLKRDVLGVIGELLEHRKLQHRQVVVTALSPDQRRELVASLGSLDNVLFCKSWSEGLREVCSP